MLKMVTEMEIIINLKIIINCRDTDDDYGDDGD